MGIQCTDVLIKTVAKCILVTSIGALRELMDLFMPLVKNYVWSVGRNERRSTSFN